MATLKTRLILRNDTTTNWDASSLVLMKGEAGVEWYVGTGDLDGDQTKDSNETAVSPKIKIGDGFTAWKDLPYIQSGMIADVVDTDKGNTVTDVEVSYTNGTYTITIKRENRVKDISVDDDDVAVLALTKPTGDSWSTSHSIKATHAKKGPKGGATTKDNSGTISPTASSTINIPRITVDEYGHTTAVTDQTVTIGAHDITVTNDGNTSGNTIISISKGDNHEVKYTKGNRVIPSNPLTANQIIVGNGTYNAKASGKTIVTSITNSDNVPTDKAVKTYVDAKVASAVQYLGTISAVANLSTTAGKGDFYRASTDVTNTWHAGDIIIAEKDNPKATVDGTNWSVIHGEEVGVESISAADKSIIIGGTAAQPTIKVNTGYTNNGKNYKVEVSDSGLFVNVPWTDNNTTYNAATSTALGLVKLGSDTVQKVAANAVTATSGKTYAVQFNSSNQLVVNVPWSDSDHRDEGFGIIKIGTQSTAVSDLTDNTTEVSASTYNEAVTFATANKWIKLAGTDNGDTSGAGKVQFAHALSTAKAGTYGQASDVKLDWKESGTSSFTLPKVKTDEAGHIIEISPITITAPNKTVTTSLRGLAPKAVTNSFLVTKNKATNASWEKVLIIDGGNASTTDWGTIS